eukprot:93567-Pleurochrysis_carterae.AAC.1
MVLTLSSGTVSFFPPRPPRKHRWFVVTCSCTKHEHEEGASRAESADAKDWEGGGGCRIAESRGDGTQGSDVCIS